MTTFRWLFSACRAGTSPAVVMQALAFTVPVLGTYGPRLMPIPAVLALVPLFHVLSRRLPLPRGIDVSLVAIICIFVGWAGASIAWSIAPDRSLDAVTVLTAILAGSLVLFAIEGELDPDTFRPIARALAAGIVVAIVIYAFEYVTGGIGLVLLKGRKSSIDEQFSVFNQGLPVLVMLAAPVALWLWREGRRRQAKLLGAAAIGVVLVGYGSSLILAVVCGLAAAGLTAAMPRLMPRAIAVATVAALLLAPVAAREAGVRLDPETNIERWENISIPHRLIIWQFAATRIAERPLLGWGLDSARKLPGADSKVLLHRQPKPRYADRLPLHPHNAFLQIWLELGFVGVVLGGAFLVALLESIHRRVATPAARAIAMGQFVTGLAVACLSFSLWQAWWLVSLMLVGLLTRPLLRGTTVLNETPARLPHGASTDSGGGPFRDSTRRTS